MSLKDVRDLYNSACKTGQISTFHTSIIQFAQKVQQNEVAAQQSAQKAKRDAEQPELDLSRVRGTPDQIRRIEALRDEIVRMNSDAEIRVAAANNQILSGMIRASGGSLSSLSQGSGYYTRVTDGHGNWFNSESEAKGSQMQIEGRIKLGEAHKLKMEVIRKRGELARLKAALGG